MNDSTARRRSELCALLATSHSTRPCRSLHLTRLGFDELAGSREISDWPSQRHKIRICGLWRVNQAFFHDELEVSDKSVSSDEFCASVEP